MSKFYVIFLFFALKGCAQGQQDPIINSVSYQASSRGYYLDLYLEKKHCFVSTTRNQESIKKDVGDDEWKSLLELLPELSDIPKNAKSGKEAMDAAIPAVLKIENGEMIEYFFDHGNPPKTLQPFLEELLSYSN